MDRNLPRRRHAFIEKDPTLPCSFMGRHTGLCSSFPSGTCARPAGTQYHRGSDRIRGADPIRNRGDPSFNRTCVSHIHARTSHTHPHRHIDLHPRVHTHAPGAVDQRVRCDQLPQRPGTSIRLSGRAAGGIDSRGTGTRSHRQVLVHPQPGQRRRFLLGVG